MAQKTSEVESTTNAASALSSAGAPEAKGKSNTCKAGLKELMEAKLISPSLRSVTFDYRNSLYTADLKEDSSIDLTDNDKVMNFRSVSAFAIYCIRRDTPSRQSCDGWMCVKYQGKPLSEIRNEYYRLNNFEVPCSPSKITKRLESRRSASRQGTTVVQVKDVICDKILYGIRCQGFKWFNIIFLEKCGCPFPFCYVRYVATTDFSFCPGHSVNFSVIKEKEKLAYKLDVCVEFLVLINVFEAITINFL
ncbi:uncharacterized protein LOC135145463 [Zophobas morio]|uniref:uncharacterized protein LOC135145463 n=1 Tax=Zophobas morio TaxID=2755281 RepID=UPI0030826E27